MKSITFSIFILFMTFVASFSQEHNHGMTNSPNTVDFKNYFKPKVPNDGLHQSILLNNVHLSQVSSIEDFQVNENGGICGQESPSVAVDNDGNYIVVWIDERNARKDIYGQRYNMNGIAINGNFRINDMPADVSSPNVFGPEGGFIDIAIGQDGGFIVVWSDDRNGDYDIYGVFFDKNGNALGKNIKISDDTGTQSQRYPVANVNTQTGDYMIVWQDRREEKYDIYFQMYDQAGNALGVNSKLSENGATYWRSQPDLATNIDGNSLIVWSGKKPDNSTTVFGQFLDKNGDKIGTNIDALAGRFGKNKNYPKIVANTDGNFVLAWQEHEKQGYNDIYRIFCRLFDSNLNPLSAILTVSDQPGYDASSPSMAAGSDGDFVIAWRYRDITSKRREIYCQYFDGNGDRINEKNIAFRDEEINYNDSETIPEVALDKSGNALIVWDGLPNDVKYKKDIYGQIFKANELYGTNFVINDDVGAGFQEKASIAVGNDGRFVIVWEDERFNNYAIYGQRFSDDGVPLDTNFCVNEDLDNLQSGPSVAINSDNRFLVAWSFFNGSTKWDVYRQGYYQDGRKSGYNSRANKDSGANNQSGAAVGGGNSQFVVVWNDDRLGEKAIFGQLRSQDGNFIISDRNTIPKAIAGGVPAVDFNSLGYYGVVWQDAIGGNNDIYCKFFANSTPLGSDVKVNDDSGISNQSKPSIGYSNNKFVITWLDERNGQFDIYCQVYDSNGKQGSNFKVNDEFSVTDEFSNPVIGIDENDNFIIAWTDYRNGVHDSDIYAQLYTSANVAIRSNIRINNDSGTNIQKNPDLRLHNGRAYFVWDDNRIEGQSFDIFAKVHTYSFDFAPPIANFVADTTFGSAPLTVQFYDNSTGNITDWKWDFGDGKTSSEQNPSHIYEVAGNFTVSLTASGPDGVDTMIREDYIEINIPTAISISPTKKPNEFKLYNNYPNPFNPGTTIRFALPKSGFVTLKIYDLLGREIATLVNEYRAVGEYKVTWTPVDLPSGIYLYRLQAGEFVETRKLILQK